MEIVKIDFKMLGKIKRRIFYYLKPLTDIFILLYYKIFKKRKYTFNNIALPYLYSLHNETFRNERAIEIPIIMHYVNLCKGKKILEIGNVLNYYFDFEHTVIDKYEEANKVLNYDITNFNLAEKYDLIVTISTLEHVGWDEYTRYGKDNQVKQQNPELYFKALENLKKILRPEGQIIATMPLGFNEFLDSLIQRNESGFSEMFFLKRITSDNLWKQVSYQEVKNAKYSSPYQCANGVFIGIFKNNF